MSNLREFANKINIRGKLLFNEPMTGYTTFRTGGPADILAFPCDIDDILILLDAVRGSGIPLTLLGGGANILVADEGIPGLVMSTSELNRFSLRGEVFKAYTGLTVSTAAWETGAAGLAGLETFFAMPGTLGGALWMNARCYGRSISDSLQRVTLLTREGQLLKMEAKSNDFGYKHSPFQNMESIILKAVFNLNRGNSRSLKEEMEHFREDRRSKGHFDAPSAGSVFKNNRSFGKPTGQIVDEAGLKGKRVGNAQISPNHGNIIFNTGGATSQDIRRLIDLVKKEVQLKFGFQLEEEVVYAGAWEKEIKNGLER